MYQFSVAEIARARWEERVCGIPTPTFASPPAKTGRAGPGRAYAAGSGRARSIHDSGCCTGVKPNCA